MRTLRNGIRFAVQAVVMRARLMSLAIHLAVIASLLLVSSRTPVSLRGIGPPRSMFHVTRVIAPFSFHGGGGGGDRSPLSPSRGKLPRPAPRQFTPPTPVVSKQNPLLPVEPTLVVPVNAPIPAVNLAQFGDPFAHDGPISPGPGRNGGIGRGSDGGVGGNTGPGLGPENGGGFSGLLRAGGRATAPVVLFRVDPEFSEEARKAKYQGTVVLTIEIGEDGKPRSFRVVRSLGLGLDEKAIEAVTRWRFRPAMHNGKPVAAAAVVEVNFRLL